MNYLKTLSLLSVVWAATTLSIPSASALLIDDFTDGSVTLTSVSFGTVSDLQTGLDPSHVAATGRHITFNAIGGTGEVTVEVDPSSGGAFRHSPDVGLSAANFFVSYGNTSLGLPPMSLDLLANGADRVSIDFAYTIPDPGHNFAMGFQIISGNNTGYYNFGAVPVSNSPFTVDIKFADILAATPTIDLSDITEMWFGTSNGTMGGAFEVVRIYTPPEPGNFATITIMLATILGRIRLRRAADGVASPARRSQLKNSLRFGHLAR